MGQMDEQESKGEQLLLLQQQQLNVCKCIETSLKYQPKCHHDNELGIQQIVWNIETYDLDMTILAISINLEYRTV